MMETTRPDTTPRRPRSRNHPAAGSSRARVRLPGPVLTYSRARRVVSALARRVRGPSVIEFDLSHVRDIDPPWMPVFALILWLARRTGSRCVLTRSNRRVGEMASIALAPLHGRVVSLRSRRGRI